MRKQPKLTLVPPAAAITADDLRHVAQTMATAISATVIAGHAHRFQLGDRVFVSCPQPIFAALIARAISGGDIAPHVTEQAVCSALAQFGALITGNEPAEDDECRVFGAEGLKTMSAACSVPRG